MYFFYSSGTTGRPKGILKETMFPPFGTGLGLDAVQAAFGFVRTPSYLCPAPLNHAAPWLVDGHYPLGPHGRGDGAIRRRPSA